MADEKEVEIQEIRTSLSIIGVLGSGIEIADNDSLFGLGLLDSLAFMNLVADLRTRFNIVVPEEDLLPDNFDSITSIAQYVNCRKRKLTPTDPMM